MRSMISSSARTGNIAALSLVLALAIGILVESAAALALDPQANVRKKEIES